MFVNQLIQKKTNKQTNEEGNTYDWHVRKINKQIKWEKRKRKKISTKVININKSFLSPSYQLILPAILCSENDVIVSAKSWNRRKIYVFFYTSPSFFNLKDSNKKRKEENNIYITCWKRATNMFILIVLVPLNSIKFKK